MASTTPYIINFNKKTGVFTLTSTKDEVKVDAKHKKYEWLKSQEAGRIVKISDKGRWNSSKDYIGLYDEINSYKSKKKSTVKSSVKTTKRKAKPVKDNSTELKELKTQLKELQTSNNKLKTENAKLRKEIITIKKGWRKCHNSFMEFKKASNVKKAIKKTEKKTVWNEWVVEIMATESYTRENYKYKKERSIKLKTVKIEKKPTKSYIKAILRKHAEIKIPKYPIRHVSGLDYLYSGGSGYKLTNITILNIETLQDYNKW